MIDGVTIKKSTLISGLGISLLFAYVYINIIIPTNNDHSIELFAVACAADIKTAGEQSHPTLSELPTFDRRLDVYEFIVGVLLACLGFIAIVLACLRWKTKDLLLLSFGVFCLFWGARTNVFPFLFNASPRFWEYERWFLTYLVPVPGFIFVEQILGRGWKSSIRRIWQIAFIFAIVNISVGIYLKKPSAAVTANNILAITGLVVIIFNLFRPGISLNNEIRILRVGFAIYAIFAFHANAAHYIFTGLLAQDLEPVGLLIGFCCLGYLVARRFFQNQKDLITIEHELETARQIQSFILPKEMARIKGLEMAARYVPMATMAGDFYDFLRIDEKRLGVLVADVSGHGVPASLIASMVKIAFVSQLPHASDPSGVLSGINRILCGKLESDFVTAGYLYIDTVRQTVSYAGAGHPPLLVWRASGQKILEFRPKGVILGQFEEASFETVSLNFEQGDRFFLYTDGVIEASDSTGELFGSDRFKAFIVSNYPLSAGRFTDYLMEDLSRWSGNNSQVTFDDDLTLVVIDVGSGGK
jgi:serine phosphatase RsbU (regulator of sigma subunit)